MAGQVVGVASGKGGVGKTTTVVNLGVVLRRTKHSVALVDADLGMANLGSMVGVNGEPTIHDVLSDTSTLREALVQKAPGFAVLPGSESLTDYPTADPRNLGAVFETLADGYDFVLVDTGAGMTHEDVLPLGLADFVVLVTTPDPAAVGNTRKTAELADLADGDIAGLVVTKAGSDTDANQLAAEIGVDLLGAIPYDATVRESTAAGRPLETLDPESQAASAYRDLADALAAGAPDPLREIEPSVEEATGTTAAEIDRNDDTTEGTELADSSPEIAADEPGESEEYEATATEEEDYLAEVEAEESTPKGGILARFKRLFW